MARISFKGLPLTTTKSALSPFLIWPTLDCKLSTFALTEVAEYSQACSANTNYFFSGSITSNNALAENDFVMTTIKKSTDNGTAYLYYNGNLELRYT